MKPKYKTYDDRKYEAWVRRKQCLICQRPYSEVHHVWHTGGKSGRNSYCAIPLCADHHRTGKFAYHILEHDGFEAHHSVNLSYELINLLSEYNFEMRGQYGVSAEIEAFDE